MSEKEAQRSSKAINRGYSFLWIRTVLIGFDSISRRAHNSDAQCRQSSDGDAVFEIMALRACDIIGHEPFDISRQTWSHILNCGLSWMGSRVWIDSNGSDVKHEDE
jgi:hypothetical protein